MNRLAAKKLEDWKAVSPLIGPDMRYDYVADIAQHAASHWQSLILAAERGDDALMVFHGKQIRVLTVECLRVVREMTGKDGNGG
jgi:hypothetical protein